jgi:hypothetical protein
MDAEVGNPLHPSVPAKQAEADGKETDVLRKHSASAAASSADRQGEGGGETEGRAAGHARVDSALINLTACFAATPAEPPQQHQKNCSDTASAPASSSERARGLTDDWRADAEAFVMHRAVFAPGPLGLTFRDADADQLAPPSATGEGGVNGAEGGEGGEGGESGEGGEGGAGGGVLVSRVGGQALALGVQPGDAIDSIGPQRVGGATRPEVVAIFKGSGRPLVVRFRRRKASVAAGRGADERRRSGVARVAAEAWSANAEPLRASGRSSSACGSRRGSRGGGASPDRPTRRKKALSRESAFLTLHEKGSPEAALPEAVPEEPEEAGEARVELQQQPRKKASSSVGRDDADGGIGARSGAAAAAPPSPQPRGCCNIS